MGRLRFHADRDKLQRHVERILDGTLIHQRQRELAVGRWDFLVFGPSSQKPGAVARVGLAEQMVIQKASVYLANVGAPDEIGRAGMMPIEELAGGDLPDELHGLEVYNISPLRPVTVLSKRDIASLDKAREQVFKEFSDTNTAIIETPDEASWIISALKYLDECDEIFPDPMMSQIRSRMRDTSVRFTPRSKLPN